MPGSLEVKPLEDFVLLEACTHRFRPAESGKRVCATFRNIMIWWKEGKGYKLSRVISYDH